MLDVPTFDERSIREAILTAVSHRDYRQGGNVFVRQYPRWVPARHQRSKRTGTAKSEESAHRGHLREVWSGRI